MTLDRAEWQERIHIDVSSNGDERLCGFLYYYNLVKGANNLSSCLSMWKEKLNIPPYIIMITFPFTYR